MAVISGKIEAILELKNRMSKKLRAAAKDMDKFQSNMTRIGEKAGKAGMAMTAAFAAPIALVGIKAVKSFATFEQSMDAVLAVTQASGEDFEKLGDLAKEMGETTVFTAAQAAEAMRAFGLAGFKTNEIMGALGPTLNLAAAGSMDMGTAADIAAKVTRGYGIEAENTTHAMDVLTKAFTTANTDLKELGGAFKMVGPVAKTAGVSFEMTTAALQIMADAGIIGSMSGRQLRRSLLRLVNPPGDAAKALKKLGVVTTTAEGRLRPFDELVEELEPHLKDTAAMAEVFGTIAMPGMVAILSKGSDELRVMTAELEAAGGTGERIAGVMLDNVAGAFVLLTSAVEGVFIAIGENLEPVLRSVLASLTGFAKFVSGVVVPGLTKLPKAIQFASMAFSVLLAALGPLLMMFGLMIPAIPPLISGLGMIAGAFSAPVLMIGAAVALFVTWMSRIESVTSLLGSFGRFLVSLAKVGIKAFLVSLDFATQALFSFWDMLSGMFTRMSGGIVEKGFNLLSRGFNAAAGWMDKFTGGTEEAAEVVDDIEKPVSDLTSALEQLGDGIDPGVIEPLADMDDKWRDIANNWKTGAIPAAEDMLRALKEVGGTTNLTVKEQQSLHTALGEAVDKYHALGQIAPSEMLKVWESTRRVADETVNLKNKIVGAISELPTFAEAFPWLTTKIQTIDVGIIPTIVGGMGGPEMVTTGQRLGSLFRQGFTEIVESIPQTIVNAFTGGGGLLGAFKAIGSRVGSFLGKTLGDSLGKSLAGLGKKIGGKMGGLLGGIAGMSGPFGAAIGALAGPLIGGLKSLFGKPSVAKSIRKAAEKMFEEGISEGLSEAIEETRKDTESDFGAMMMHMADIIKEQGGVMAMGMEKAISSVRDIFSAVEQGAITTEQAAETFDSSFRMIADALVDSGEVASHQFTELIDLANRFGTTAETIKFVAEQSLLASKGLAALFGPTIADANALNEEIAATNTEIEGLGEQILSAQERLKGMEEGTKEYSAAQDELNVLLDKQTELEGNLNNLMGEHEELAGKSKAELEDLGLIAVASFESALAAGMRFTEAVEKHGPAIDAVIQAQEALGITTDNVALKALVSFRDRVEQNKGLVAGVEALDSTMLALSRTGSLNAETLGAMERQGMRMYDRLIAAGFSQNEAILMMGPSLKTMMEAHERLGIPIDENTQALIDQATEAGVLEGEQTDGWGRIESAIMLVVGEIQKLIGELVGAKNAVDDIPKEVIVSGKVNWETGKMPTLPGDFSARVNFHGPQMQEGGIVTSPTIGLIGEGGPEAVIPLSRLDQRDNMLMEEFQGLRADLRNMPIMLRDALILAQ